jgi:endonuclease YncB( thermonuclease family)
MTQAVYFIAALLIAVVVMTFQSLREPRPLEAKRRHATVAYVIDGDTLVLEGVKQPIRLWGVDAAEQHDSDSFKAARLELVRLVMHKRVSYIEIDTDRYKRIVARVFLQDGREVNQLMLDAGQVTEVCRFSGGFYGHC